MTRVVHVVDSHTGGEPTRVVLSGAPEFRGKTPAEKLEDFRVRHDAFRSAVVNEPRGSDVMVGAVLLDPVEIGSVAGVIFFNNVGFLGMCGHGTIGLIRTLAHLGRIQVGVHSIETPVGIVSAELHEDGGISIENVPSHRLAKGVKVQVPGYGEVTGDVAWGGNWFFLTENCPCAIELANVEALTLFTWAVRQALVSSGITGTGGGEIDHVEVFTKSPTPGVDSRNFVLCPGKAYDRSPCGTGTSAKLACLHEDGKLPVGAVWRQESVVGTVFEGSVRKIGSLIIPKIRGHAWVNGEAKLLLDSTDPFCDGIRAK